MLHAKSTEIVLEECVAVRKPNPVPVILPLENGPLQLISPIRDLAVFLGALVDRSKIVLSN